MSTWYHILPDSDINLVEAVEAIKETPEFLYIEETWSSMGKQVKRQRRVAKHTFGSWRGSYYPTRRLALESLRDTARDRLAGLTKEVGRQRERFERITTELDTEVSRG